MIEARNLTKYYGPIAAIEEVSFEVAQGEIIGFLGPNAAGKTTTMRILSGFSPASRGTARVAGFDVHEQPLEVKRRVGYLPENVPLYPEMRVSKFLEYVAAVKGLPRGERRIEVGRVLERCGLDQMAHRTIRNLSKGFKQRVGLAQALIGNPPVLILDEPTIGLDPKQIIEIRRAIKDLAQEHTVLLSTHILQEVTMVCQRVLIIHQGRIVAEDSVRNLAGSLGGSVRLEMEIRGPHKEVVATLEGVAGVKGVTREGGDRYVVETEADEAVCERVAQALVGAGYGLRALRERARTLEDVFVEAIASDQEGHP